MRIHQRQTVQGWLFISPWLLGFLLLTFYPFLASLYWSFCNYDLLTPAQWTGTDHYERIADEIVAGREFGQALWNTFYYALLVIPGSVVLGVALAMMLRANVRGQAVYRTLFFLPSIVPTVAVSIVWMWLLDPQQGIVNSLLGFSSTWFNSSGEVLNPTTWQSGPGFGAKDGLALMSLWGIGNFIIIYLAALENIPAELYEAATLEGANSAQQFWHITRPQLSPVIFLNLVMGLVAAVQYFTQAYVVSGGTGGPENSTRVLSLHIFLWAFKYQDAGYANAAAWTLFVCVMVITALIYRSSRSWVHV